MATLEELKTEATELGLEFKAKATKSEIEALIADANEETIDDVKDETVEETIDAPKLNKDGLVAGQPVSDEDYTKIMAKQRAKK